MENSDNAGVQKLIAAFFQFKKLNWNHSPIQGLKRSEFHVLISIDKLTQNGEEDVRISEISKHLKVASPTTTQVVNGLEEDGYVERSMDKEDRRSIRVKLTDKGNIAIKKAKEEMLKTFDGLVQYLGEEDSDKLSELLTKVFNYFDSIHKKEF